MEINLTDAFNCGMFFECMANLPTNERRCSSLRGRCLDHFFRMVGQPIKEDIMKRQFLETAAKMPTLKDLYKETNKFTDQPEDKNLTTLLPYEMTMASPFVIESRRFMKQKVYNKRVVADHEWGRVTMEGQPLNVFDEDLLLILIYLMKKHGQFYFHTSLYEICGIKGTAVRKDTANAIWESLERITGTTVIIETREDIKRGRFKAMFHLIDEAFLREATGQVCISINDYFYKLWGQHMVTHMDLKKRLKLKGDITKALFRFLEGQSKFQIHSTKYLSLLQIADVLNLESEEMYTLRWQIRKAIGNLVDEKYLMQSSGINKYDTVFFRRVSKRKSL